MRAIRQKESSELYHYGVLGMKWGIRKQRKKNITLSKDRKEVDEYLKKDVRELSDAELNRVLNRLGSEDRYRQMTTKKSKNKGSSWVKKTLSATTAMASIAASKALYKQGEKWTKQFMEGFARGYERSSVERWAKEEAKRRMNRLMVIHSDESELYHYGVKGMKWGVRKRREKKPLTVKQKRLAEYKQYEKLKKKKSKDLSMDELRSVVERDELEWKRKKYSKYVKPGESYAKKFLVSTGSKLIGDAVLIGAAYVGAKYVEKQLKSGIAQLRVSDTVKTAKNVVNIVKKASPPPTSVKVGRAKIRFGG